MNTIFLSEKNQQKELLMIVLVATMLFTLPFLITVGVRSLYGAELDFIYQYCAVGVLLLAFLPLAVLHFSRRIVPKIGKYGFSFLLSISLSCLMLFNNSGSEKMMEYQWFIAVPLMIGATLFGFFSPHKILLPRLYTPVFFMLVGVLSIVEIINIIMEWLPSGCILNVLIVLFFACLQAGQANILRHRLQRRYITQAEKTILIWNYGLIFAINFCGLLLSAHAMKICLAFMFDNIAAKNGMTKKRSFS